MSAVSMRRAWVLRPDPMLVTLIISIAAGMFLLLAGERLGFQATFHGQILPLDDAPDFKLTDQFGETRSLSDFGGGPVVLTFYIPPAWMPAH